MAWTPPGPRLTPMRRTLVGIWLWCALLGGAPAGEAPGGARQVALQSPLTTLVRLPQPLTAPPRALQAVVDVPADAPADLGVGVFVVDQHGRWFQGLRPGVLAPGTHALELPVSGPGTLLAMADRGAWTPAAAAQLRDA